MMVKTLYLSVLITAISACTLVRIPYYPSSIKGTPDSELSLIRPIGDNWQIDRSGNISGLELEIYVSPGPHSVSYYTKFREIRGSISNCKTIGGSQVSNSEPPPSGYDVICEHAFGRIEMRKALGYDVQVDVRLVTEPGRIYVIQKNGDILDKPNPYLN